MMLNAFKPCSYLGLYPVVDSFEWIELLVRQGVKTIQLRIKDSHDSLEDVMQKSILFSKQNKILLFINDHWELALKLGAEGVHLGQEDLETADLNAIQQEGLFLGISAYTEEDITRAKKIRPSYIAVGPIYPTQSKSLTVAAQGLERLTYWQQTLNYPLVAIGGINKERIADVAATGVSGIALISAITKAADPEKATQVLLDLIKENSP